MRFTFAILPVAVLGSAADPCARLCALDGPLICTDGSYNKNGACHRYVFRGDPALNDYCYHTSATASTCPGSGKTVKLADAERLIALRGGQQAVPVPQRTAPPRIVAPTITTAAPDGNTIQPSVAELEHLMLALGLTEEEALEDMMARDAMARRPEPYRFNPVPPAKPAVPAIKPPLPPSEVARLPIHKRLDTIRAEITARLAGNGRLPMIDTDREKTLVNSLPFLNGPLNSFVNNYFFAKFKNEPGYGRGQMKEWFAEVTRQIFSPKSGFFVLSDSAPLYYKINPTGLTQQNAREIYRAAGRLLALSMIRNIPIGVNLPVMFYAKLLDHQLTLDEVSVEEPLLVQSMRFLLSLPEADLADYPVVIDGVEVVPTMENRAELVLRKINSLIESDVAPIFALIKNGFDEAIPTARAAGVFTARELKSLILGQPDIDIDDLFANSDIYFRNPNTRTMLKNVLTGFNQEQRRKFLRFVTNQEQTPVGGFANLVPRMSIQSGYPSQKMPRVQLCFHELTIPDYATENEMREVLTLAIESGTGWS